ncbi:Retrovirus-related Pol polyprotein from transposon TNT 1-94 [Nymphaea thermarum]|nr:Retrovirus-related Pol polyprotein from transposon TNT 1-94 [Nymphaea thermarum]
MGYNGGSFKCPNEFLPSEDGKETVLNPAFLEWHRGDQLLLSWIISSLSVVVNSQVIGLDSSYKVWTTIKRIYAAQSIAKVQQLKSALQNLKKRTESITAYFHKAKGIAHQLAMASKPVDEEDLVMNIFSGLPAEEYGTLKTSLRTRVDPINLEELYSLLLIQESEISKPASFEDPSAYIVQRQNVKNHYYRGKPEQQKRHPGHRPQDKFVNCHACEQYHRDLLFTDKGGPGTSCVKWKMKKETDPFAFPSPSVGH